jgi:hypothetical protein
MSNGGFLNGIVTNPPSDALSKRWVDLAKILCPVLSRISIIKLDSALLEPLRWKVILSNIPVINGLNVSALQVLGIFVLSGLFKYFSTLNGLVLL